MRLVISLCCTISDFQKLHDVHLKGKIATVPYYTCDMDTCDMDFLEVRYYLQSKEIIEFVKKIVTAEFPHATFKEC